MSDGSTSVTTIPFDETRVTAGPPPHPLDAEWYMHSGGERYGPFTGHRMKELMLDGRLTRETDVVRTDSQTWGPAGSDTALGSLFKPLAPSNIPHTFEPVGNVTAGQGATVV